MLFSDSCNCSLGKAFTSKLEWTGGGGRADRLARGAQIIQIILFVQVSFLLGEAETWYVWVCKLPLAPEPNLLP